MDTGSIEITEDDHGNCTVTARSVDGNVWMTQYEIVRFCRQQMSKLIE